MTFVKAGILVVVVVVVVIYPPPPAVPSKYSKKIIDHLAQQLFKVKKKKNLWCL